MRDKAIKDVADKEIDWTETLLYQKVDQELNEIPIPEIKKPNADDAEILPPDYVKDLYLDLCMNIREILVEQIGLPSIYNKILKENNVSEFSSI